MAALDELVAQHPTDHPDATAHGALLRRCVAHTAALWRGLNVQADAVAYLWPTT